jgi:hypothetical protein
VNTRPGVPGSTASGLVMAKRDEISLDSLTQAVGPISCLFEATVHRGADRLNAAGTKKCLVMLVGP